MSRTTQERFDDKWVLAPDCHWWTGARVEGNHGKFRVGGKVRQASHVAYEIHIGPIPDGMHVHHTCGNTLCVNPDHLIVSTPVDIPSNKRVTDEQVVKIREMYATGIYTQQELGDYFCTTREYISLVVNHKRRA